MLVYHGSNHCFKWPKISSTLDIKESSKNNEGLGLYFSIYRDVAASYGKYIYTIEIDDKNVIDFRKKKYINSFLRVLRNSVRDEYSVDLYSYVDFQLISEYLLDGRIAFWETWAEIALVLDSNEQYYFKVNNNVKKSIIRKLKRVNESLAAYLFPYNIKGVGVIKHLSVIKSVKRERVSA